MVAIKSGLIIEVMKYTLAMFGTYLLLGVQQYIDILQYFRVSRILGKRKAGTDTTNGKCLMKVIMPIYGLDFTA